MTKDEMLSELAGKLSELDKSLLLGTESGWGSWMFTSGSYMANLGLGTKRNGSIAFDTPLAKDMIAYLRSRVDHMRGDGSP